MSLTLIHFKIFYLLLILEIILIALNFISTILSIILRLWRSDESVFEKNFSSSSWVSCLLLVLVLYMLNNIKTFFLFIKNKNDFL